MSVVELMPEEWPRDLRDRLAELFVLREVDDGVVLRSLEAEDRELQLVVAGTVVVHDDQGHELAQLGPGSWIGELSWLYGGSPRAAVTALGDVTVAAVDGEVLDEMAGVDVVRRDLESLAARREATNRAVHLDPVDVGVHPTPDGPARLQLRPMWPDDWRWMLEDADRVSEESLRRRFFTRPTFTERRLRGLTAVDFLTDFVWVVLADQPVAIGRYGRPIESPDRAEVAFLVADEWQRRGLGRLLMGALAIAAEAQGITTFEALSRSDNHAVHGMLAPYGVTWRGSESPGVLEAEWAVADVLAHPDVQSLRPLVRPVVEQILGSSS